LRTLLKPKCHPNRPYRSNGFCDACYWKWYAKEHPNRDREKFLNRTYSITLAQYNEMLVRQGGKCAICGHPPKTRALNTDHNHKTKQVRGLLCHKCNRALGLLQADSRPEIGAAVDRYLRRAADING